jgi:O-antigen/teichoic acid export membrane protein
MSWLFRTSAQSLLIKLLGVALSLAASAFVAQQLGPSGYGQYLFFIALAATLSILVKFGLPKFLIRETARNIRSEQAEALGPLVAWSHKLAIFAFALLFTLVAILSSLDVLPASINWLLGPTAVLTLLISVTEMRSAILQGFGRVLTAQIPDVLVRPLIFIIILFLMILSAPTAPSTIGVVIAHVTAAAIAYFIGTALLIRIWSNRSNSPALSLLGGLQFLKPVMALGSIAGFQTLNANADGLMLSLLVSEEALGLYKPAVLFSSLVAFGLQAVIAVAAHKFSTHYYSDDHRALRNIAMRSARLSFLLAIPPAIMFLVFGEEIIVLIFGPAYAVGYDALSILVLGQLASSLFGPVGALLSMSGNERLVVRGVAIACLANVLLNFILIPRFELVGAAIATAATACMWNLILWRDVRHRLGINTIAFR